MRHIKFNRESESGRESGDSEAGESQTAGLAVVVENQNLFETKGSDANKIEAESK